MSINIHAKFLSKPHSGIYTFKVIDKNLVSDIQSFYPRDKNGVIDVYGKTDTKFIKNKNYNIKIYSDPNCDYSWNFYT